MKIVNWFDNNLEKELNTYTREAIKSICNELEKYREGKERYYYIFDAEKAIMDIFANEWQKQIEIIKEHYGTTPLKESKRRDIYVEDIGLLQIHLK